MSTSVTISPAHRILLASEFFMARRPVLDPDQQLAAHELLFCAAPGSGEAGEGAGDTEIHEADNASVLADVVKYGLGKIIGDAKVYIEVDAATLMGNVCTAIPHDRAAFAILPGTEPTPTLLKRIAELRLRGMHFAVDVKADSPAVQAFLPLVDTVKIDIAGKLPLELAALAAQYRAQGKMLFAENVDDLDQFAQCQSFGFERFQGYFFAKPHILAGKKVTPSQLAIIELMALVTSDADTAEIEHAVKADVALGLNLLRMVNTPAFGTHRIESLRQALMVLGRNQLQRWLQIMLYAESDGAGGKKIPLLMLAAARGRLLELIAQSLRPGNRSIADTAFTVGIMSLMDTLFSMPMDEILKQIRVVEEVHDALLDRSGYFGRLLTLVEETEWVEKGCGKLQRLTSEMRLSPSDLYSLQLSAFEWSDHVARISH
jgi:EAL and modified HD-GYP domain-containing signal transduction protein